MSIQCEIRSYLGASTLIEKFDSGIYIYPVEVRIGHGEVLFVVRSSGSSPCVAPRVASAAVRVGVRVALRDAAHEAAGQGSPGGATEGGSAGDGDHQAPRPTPF